MLSLADEYGVEDSRGTMVALKITHQELANLIGSTRETVSLTLSQFKRKNLICTEGRKVIIGDVAHSLQGPVLAGRPPTTDGQLPAATR